MLRRLMLQQCRKNAVEKMRLETDLEPCFRREEEGAPNDAPFIPPCVVFRFAVPVPRWL